MAVSVDRGIELVDLFPDSQQGDPGHHPAGQAEEGLAENIHQHCCNKEQGGEDHKQHQRGAEIRRRPNHRERGQGHGGQQPQHPFQQDAGDPRRAPLAMPRNVKGPTDISADTGGEKIIQKIADKIIHQQPAVTRFDADAFQQHLPAQRQHKHPTQENHQGQPDVGKICLRQHPGDLVQVGHCDQVSEQPEADDSPQEIHGDLLHPARPSLP